MSLINLSIPVQCTATTSYNPSTRRLSRPCSLPLTPNKNTFTPIVAYPRTHRKSLMDKTDLKVDRHQHQDDKHNSFAMKQITDDDMLSLHSSKSEPFLDNTTPPALPEKSALRASRLLATLPQKLAQDRPVLTPAAPHLVYLSSEEDISSSADDLSDLESFDSDAPDSYVANASQTELARAVPVIFSGKPSMINLTSRSTSLLHLDTNTPTTVTALRTASTEPTLSRLDSASSVTSSYHSYHGLGHPPRSSSMMKDLDQRRPSFLHVDSYTYRGADDEAAPKTPKTPTAMFSRAINLVKKRSRPALNVAANRDAEFSRMEQVGEEVEAADSSSQYSNSPRISFSGAAMFGGKNAHYLRSGSPSSPSSPGSPPRPTSSASTTRDRYFSFSLRRMSIRG